MFFTSEMVSFRKRIVFLKLVDFIGIEGYMMLSLNLRGNIYFLVHKGSQLNDYERKILKSFKNKSYLKNIITIISISVISYLIFKYI